MLKTYSITLHPRRPALRRCLYHVRPRRLHSRLYRRGDDTVYLLLYVDDIVLTTSTVDLLQRTIVDLQR
jgi:hypothetical protein